MLISAIQQSDSVIHICIHACLVAQLCWTLCNPMDCSLLGSSVLEILQAKILEWVALSFSRESSQSRDRTLSYVFCIGRPVFYHWWKWSRSVMSESLQPCGLSPARLLCPWDSPGKNTGVGCHAPSRGSSHPRNQTQVSCIAGGFFTIWATREALWQSCICKFTGKIWNILYSWVK